MSSAARRPFVASPTPGFARWPRVAVSAGILCGFFLLAPAPRAAAETDPRPTSPALSSSEEVPSPPGRDVVSAVVAALEHGARLGEARALRRAAAARVEEAEAGRRPRVAARASATRHEEPVPTTPIHGFGPGRFPEFDRTVGEAEVALRWDLWDGGATRARIDGARARENAAGEVVAASRDRLVVAAVDAYATVLVRRAVADAHRRRLAALEAEADRVERLFAVGRAAAVDRQRITAVLADAGAEQVRLDSELDLAERSLARLTGWPVEAARAGVLEPFGSSAPGLESELETAGGVRFVESPVLAPDHPELARAAAELAARQTAVELATSARRPRVELRGAWRDFADSDGRVDGEWLAGLEVTVPLFDGGRLDARVAAAEAERVAAAERLEAVRRDLEAAVDGARAALIQATARERALGEAVGRFAEVARVEALRLEQGVGLQSDLLTAEADLFEARAARARARFSRLVARTELARARGVLDPAWVREHLASSAGLPSPSSSPPSSLEASGSVSRPEPRSLPEPRVHPELP